MSTKKKTTSRQKPTAVKAKLQIVKPVAGGKTAAAAKRLDAIKPTYTARATYGANERKADSRHKLSDADVAALRAEFRKDRTDADGKLYPGARGKGLITLGALAKKWGISTRYASTLVHAQARAKAA